MNLSLRRLSIIGLSVVGLIVVGTGVFVLNRYQAPKADVLIDKVLNDLIDTTTPESPSPDYGEVHLGVENYKQEPLKGATAHLISRVAQDAPVEGRIVVTDEKGQAVFYSVDEGDYELTLDGPDGKGVSLGDTRYIFSVPKGKIKQLSFGRVNYPPNAPPQLTITSLQSDESIQLGKSYTIKYTLQDDDDTKVSFAIDTDDQDFDGRLLAGCQQQSKGTNKSCTTVISRLNPGKYRIYALTQDGVNIPVSMYAPGILRIINTPPTFAFTNIGRANLTQGEKREIHYRLRDVDTSDAVTVSFFTDTDNAGANGTAIATCQSLGKGDDQVCTWDTAGLAVGVYNLYTTATDGSSDITTYATPTLAILPATPTNIAATSTKKKQATITWTDNATGEGNYAILRSNEKYGTYNQIATTAADATSYTDTDNNLKSNQTYHYKVQALATNGREPYTLNSAQTDSVSVKIK